MQKYPTGQKDVENASHSDSVSEEVQEVHSAPQSTDVDSITHGSVRRQSIPFLRPSKRLKSQRLVDRSSLAYQSRGTMHIKRINRVILLKW